MYREGVVWAHVTRAWADNIWIENLHRKCRHAFTPMSNYDALASFILLCLPLVGVVAVLNWWLCPLDESDRRKPSPHEPEDGSRGS
jgi:hypothetical protein